MADGGNCQAVEVKVGRGKRHCSAFAWVGFSFCSGVNVIVTVSRSGNGVGRVYQIVFQIQDEEVAGAQAQSGRLIAVGVKVAETQSAVWFGEIADGQVEFQHTVLAAQIRGFGDCGAGRGARAGSDRGFLGAENHRPVDEPQACKEQQKQPFRDDYQCANDLLRKLGSVFEFAQYYCDLTIAI